MHKGLTTEQITETPRQRIPSTFVARTVAIVGPDGAGKTEICRQLVASSANKIKYLYMGTNTESSNVSLPTSKLAHWWKVRKHRRKLLAEGKQVPAQITLHGHEHRTDRRGKLGAFLRLLLRISEESYRQWASWTYQWRGYTVLYDRHFLFDICPPNGSKNHRLTDRVNHWFLKHVYPRPQLVIFLDAPAEVLYARKQEVPVEYLEAKREEMWMKRKFVTHFVRIDASGPIEQVLADVERVLQQYSRPNSASVRHSKSDEND